MLSLLAALAFQSAAKPVWAVAEFRDLKTAKYGGFAARAMACELAKGRAVAPGTVVNGERESGGDLPAEKIAAVVRRAAETMGEDAQEATVVLGEVTDYRVDHVGGSRQARVLIHAVAYDAASGAPVNGAYEMGMSVTRATSVSDGALMIEALENAAAIVVRAFDTGQIPTAIIMSTQSYTPLINRGSRDGFKEGLRVVVIRGRRLVARAHVQIAEADQAELAFDPPTKQWRPGDRVRAVVTPPAIPKNAPICVLRLTHSR